MKLKVLAPFEDFKDGIIRQKGEVMTVTKERFAELETSLPLGFFEETGKEKDEVE